MNTPQEERKEEEFVAIAKKYVPDLDGPTEDLVRSMARCKLYGRGDPMHPESAPISCACSLCLRLTIHKIKRMKGEAKL